MCPARSNNSINGISSNWIVFGFLKNGESCVASMLLLEEVGRQETRGSEAGAFLLMCSYPCEIHHDVLQGLLVWRAVCWHPTLPAVPWVSISSLAGRPLWPESRRTTHFIKHEGRFCQRLPEKLRTLQFEMMVSGLLGCRKPCQTPLRV